MPPAGMAPANEAELRTAIKNLEDALGARTTAIGPDPGHIAPHRLNRTEYNNTIRDLLGVDMHAADDFPQDDAVYGFDNIADSLSISPLLMEKYIAAAEKVANTAIFGPDLKPEPVRIDVAIPRRMETTSYVPITKPAYYSMSDYDVTGLSQPGSYHLTTSCRLPPSMFSRSPEPVPALPDLSRLDDSRWMAGLRRRSTLPTWVCPASSAAPTPGSCA